MADLFPLLAVDVPTVITTDLARLAIPVATRCLWAIGILIITRFTIRIVNRLARQTLGRMEATLRKFLVQVAEILTLMVGILAALNALQIETTTVVAVVGAAGLAAGLALQGTLSHFAAGVMLIILRPFEVGDVVEGAGVEGMVDGIGLFSTTLITADNIRITVPNSNLFSTTLKNKTVLGTRRVDLEIGIGDRPIDATIRDLIKIAHNHTLVLPEPQPTCEVTAVAVDNTVLTLRPWCQAEHYAQIKSDLQKQIKELL
ncbi:mechanosensitive ion channel protein MscS [Leptolyngbya sp. 'hensonii']|uniref:mechanosensitive ion channel family protein n=1 Tax=Leptolyngbya sp. 'hensonii' TaxID=1922337 RepID=UPI000950061C|nr:mechanosensitive ion channel family protein [Leptolyngbya sp. 'hensonii']OLP19882.1 mechanosensitive ion channel protein MscS [Leptolyngbya sp. 'hensonii']